MSKAAKQSIFILIFLLVACLGFAGYTLLQKQQLEQAKQATDRQLGEALEREKKNLSDNKKLQDQLKLAMDERAQLTEKIKSAEKQAKDLLDQIAEASAERDQIKASSETLKQERDQLVAKVQSLTEEAASSKNKSSFSAVSSSDQPQAPAAGSSSSTASPANTDEYWASVLRDKAALEVQLDNLKSGLDKKSAEMVDLQQKNTDLQLQLDSLKHNTEQADQEMKYRSDLINNLSLELARSRNDKKFVSDRVEKLNEENSKLRQQLQQLANSKGALEKSIVRLTEDKNKISKELGQTETLVQSKIDEIWEIKESLDKTIREGQKKMPVSNEIELPPIHVTSEPQAPSASKKFDPGEKNPGFSGKVVSINTDNNFVIVDIGEAEGLRVGDVINVYRDSKYIARLEVIQVRKDISAADIKEQWSKIVVGDTVR